MSRYRIIREDYVPIYNTNGDKATIWVTDAPDPEDWYQCEVCTFLQDIDRNREVIHNGWICKLRDRMLIQVCRT
jgi:hypothetical protein